ncbi:MAG: hypothetical protein E6Z13_08425, partial [Dermabacter sp.]|nr:hypothetical protein [Dermabacter sp.]
VGLGSGKSSRRVLFTSHRGSVIESEIVIDTTGQASDPQGSRPDTTAHPSGQLPPAPENDRSSSEGGNGKTPPPYEGDVL